MIFSREGNRHILRTGLLNLYRHSLVRNLGYLFASQVAIRLSRIVTIVFVSRHLSAADYGAVASVLLAYEFICVFTRNGIGQAVIHASHDHVEEVAQTAWTLTWIICIILVLLQFALSVPLAIAMGSRELALPIAAMGFIYLVNPFCNIQSSFISRQGRIGIMAGATTVQVATDNLLSAVFAVLGMGLWAVILPKLLVAPIWLFVNRYGHPWRPSGKPSLKGARDILIYSRGFIGGEIFSVIQQNMDTMFVRIFFSVEALGLYYFAFNAGIGITMGLVTAFSMAVFPWLCAVNKDKKALLKRYNTVLLAVVGLVSVLVLLQTSLAWFYVPLVYSAKWIPAIPVLIIICLSAVPRSFTAMSTQLLRASGKPGEDFRWQVISACVLAVCLVGAVYFSLEAVAWSVLFAQTSIAIPFSLKVYRNLRREAAEECTGDIIPMS